MTSNARLTQAAYQAQPGGPLDPDRGLYDRIGAAPRTVVEQFVLPIRSGRAWAVKKGQVCRITTVEGAQVCVYTVPVGGRLISERQGRKS